MKVYETLIEKIAYPSFDLLTGSTLTKYLNHLRQNDNLDYKEMKTLQLTKLRRLLDFACSNLDRYKTVEYVEDPVEHLRNFPLMDRSTLKKGAAGNLVPNYDKNGSYYSSGGSTSEIAYAYLSNVKLAHEKFQTDKIDLEFRVVDDLTKYKSGKIQRVINDLIGDKSELAES